MTTRSGKSPTAFRTISEVADDLRVPQHVLRFWEGKFSQVKPVKRGGGRRYYRPEDVDLLRAIQSLLYDDKFTIKGVQKLLREQGVKTVVAAFAQADGAAAFEIKSRNAGEAAERDDEDVPDFRPPAEAGELRELIGELEVIRGLLQNPPTQRV